MDTASKFIDVALTILGILGSVWGFFLTPQGRQLSAALKALREERDISKLSAIIFGVAAKYQSQVVDGLKKRAADGSLTQ